MENASKALIMAASILIGIIILSLAVYLFVTFGYSSAKMYQEIETARLDEFNTQFTSYENKNDTTIYDIISVVNLAKENNKYYNLDEQGNNNFYINIEAKGIGAENIKDYALEKKDDNILNNYIEKDQNNMDKVTDDSGTEYTVMPTYTCKVTINETTNRVSKVSFEKN